MAQLFSDYASTQLTLALSNIATSMTVLDASAFPTVAPGDYFYATIIDQASWEVNALPPAQREVVKVTLTAGNVWTISRGAYGTSAQNWIAPSIVELRVAAQSLLDLSGGAGGYLQAVNNLSDVANKATSFTNLQFLTSAAGGVARSARDKAMDIVSIKDFGDTSGDCTAVINLAIAAVAGGGTIYFPPGVYRTNGLHVLPNFVNLVGAGLSSAIYASHATNDIITLSGSYNDIHDLQFSHTVPRTAGAYIRASGGNTKIYNCLLWQAFVGISVNATIVDIYECNFTNVQTNGIGIQVVNGIDLSVRSCVWPVPASTTPKCGIEVQACADLQLIDLNVIGQNIDLLIDPGAGQAVASLYALNCFFDTAVRGVDFVPTGTGVITRCVFNNCWASSHTNNGFLLENSATGTIDGVDFINCQAFGNTQDGLRIQTNSAHHIKIIGGEFAGNGNNGISALVASVGLQIIGATCGATSQFSGNAQRGVLINSATIQNLVVQGCIFTGNTAGGLLEVMTNTSKNLTNNVGYNPLPLQAIAVGASPFVYTNNVGSALNVFIQGGTVSNVALNANTLYTATGCVVHVPQNAFVTVTYSALPTMSFIGD